MSDKRCIFAGRKDGLHTATPSDWGCQRITTSARQSTTSVRGGKKKAKRAAKERFRKVEGKLVPFHLLKPLLSMFLICCVDNYEHKEVNLAAIFGCPIPNNVYSKAKAERTDYCF